MKDTIIAFAIGLMVGFLISPVKKGLRINLFSNNEIKDCGNSCGFGNSANNYSHNK